MEERIRNAIIKNAINAHYNMGVLNIAYGVHYTSTVVDVYSDENKNEILVLSIWDKYKEKKYKYHVEDAAGIGFVLISEQQV